MQKLGITAGDYVEIHGKKTTVAVAWPAYADDQGQGIIRMDGLIRRNAGVAINEYVTVRKAEVREAQSVVLAPTDVRLNVDEEFTSFVKRRFIDMAFFEGDMALLSVFGSAVPLIVTRTRPHGPVKVTEYTNVQVLTEPVPEKKGIPMVTYEDIGGLHEEVQRIREMVELPLRHPELFQRLGIDPPRGVLLYGPPGTGKTLLAKAVANESDANFYAISGPEIMCVEPKLRILTDKYGVISVEELYQAGRPIGDGSVATDATKVLSWINGSCAFSNLQFVRKMRGAGYRLTLKNGVSQDMVNVSRFQRFLAFDGISVGWRTAEEIRPGYWVAAPKSWNYEGAEQVLDWINEYPDESSLIVKLRGRLADSLGETCSLAELRSHVRARSIETDQLESDVVGVRRKPSRSKGGWIRLPMKLVPELAYFIGLILSDGRLDEDGASFSSRDLALKEPAATLFKQLFNIEGTGSRSGILAWYIHHFFDVPYGGRAGLWRVPKRILMAQKAVVEAFIAGIYDGDAFYSKSQEGLIGLQLLLLRLGISKTRVARHNAPFGSLWKLMVSRAEYGKLAPLLRQLAKKYRSLRGAPDRTRFPMVAVFKDVMREHGIKPAALGDENAEARINGRLPMSDTFAERYLETLKRLIPSDNPIAAVQSLVSLRWLKVLDKKPVEMDFYDLQVEHETFVGSKATPVIYHNSKFYGESEARLREIFQKAQETAPSIIFIDELDAIAPKREEVTGEVERRVVAQLLALMDGLSARGNVVVIGATNRPGAIDPALRRPGRFDREIELRVPDVQGRYEILLIHTRNMPLDEDVELKKLAEITHGYTGADIAALCREAAMKALRRYIPEINLEEERIPPEVLEKMVVKMDDFMAAYREITPTAMREVYIEVPEVRWEDVGGLKEVRQQLVEAVEWPLKRPDVFKKMGIKPPKGILLYGPPGCGKTLLAKAVATESEANFISIKGPEVFCVSGDTPILTSLCGLQPIGEVFNKLNVEGRDVVEIDGVKVPAVDERGKASLADVKKIYRLFVGDAYTFTFSNNADLTTSANQPFLTFKDDKIEWVKAADLQIGDMIAVPKRIPLLRQAIKFSPPQYEYLRVVNEDHDFYHTKIFSTKVITKLPKVLTPELAEFLGWFVAEGNVSKEAVSIANKDERNQKRIARLFQLFVPRERVKLYGDKVIVYSTPLVKFLENLFGMKLKRKSHKIQIPPELFKGSDEVIVSFLRGLYDGDGYRGKTKIEYGTRSEKLAQGLKYLLTLLGIRSKYWTSKGLFIITISGKKDIQEFNNLVYGEAKGEIRRFYNACYRIPDISGLLRRAKEELGLVYGKHIPEGLIEGIVNKRKRCGLLRLRRIMKYIDLYATADFKEAEVYRTLKFISEGDLEWITVKRKEKSQPQWMYDLETDLSTFIGGKLPLLLHNSKWVGESEKAIREVFRKARMAAPAIIFLDEVDAIVPRRGMGYADSGVTERVISQLLTEMDGVESLQNVVVIGATNRPDIIDPAVLRPGRFDRLIYVPAPDAESRKEIFKIHTKNMPLSGNVELDQLAKMTQGYSGADIEAVCREAALIALRRNIDATEVAMEDFKAALEMIKPSITPDMEAWYEGMGRRMRKEKVTLPVHIA